MENTPKIGARVTRRRLIQSAGAVGLASLTVSLIACGDEEDAPPATPTATATTPATTATAAPGTATPAGTGSPAPSTPAPASPAPSGSANPVLEEYRTKYHYSKLAQLP